MVLTAGCGSEPAAPTEPEKRSASQAIVIVSGGDATSPFTTPDQACATGLAAGNTDTALRQHLLEQGYTVYTSPAIAGRGQVVDQTGFGPFGICRSPCPENAVVDSTASIDTAGEHLARFLVAAHREGRHRRQLRRPFDGRAVLPLGHPRADQHQLADARALAYHPRHPVAGQLPLGLRQWQPAPDRLPGQRAARPP